MFGLDRSICGLSLLAVDGGTWCAPGPVGEIFLEFEPENCSVANQCSRTMQYAWLGDPRWSAPVFAQLTAPQEQQENCHEQRQVSGDQPTRYIGSANMVILSERTSYGDISYAVRPPGTEPTRLRGLSTLR